MSKIDIALQWMIDTANDDYHGYSDDPNNRWGPDYDCSSAVISAWEYAGVPVRSIYGADTTRNMRTAFLQCGFTDVFSSVNVNTQAGLVRGDVLLAEGVHTAMYMGNGQMVHASQDLDGYPGDYYNRGEFLIESYRNTSGWNCVLRYTADTPFTGNPVIRDGQIHANNFIGAGLDPDGHRGPATIVGAIKVLQHAMNLDYNAGLEVDGVFGAASDAALGTHYVQKGEVQYMVTAAEILLMLCGYNPGGVEVPGSFGDGLEAAVRSFQANNGLAVDGVCGAATFRKLIQ